MCHDILLDQLGRLTSQIESCGDDYAGCEGESSPPAGLEQRAKLSAALAKAAVEQVRILPPRHIPPLNIVRR